MKTKIAKLLPTLLLGLGLSYSGLSFDIRGDSHLSEVFETFTKPEPAFAQQQHCPATAEQIRKYLSDSMRGTSVNMTITGLTAGQYTGKEQLEQALNEVKKVWMYPPCYNIRTSIEEPFEPAWRVHVENLHRSDMARIENQYRWCLVYANSEPSERRCKESYNRSQSSAYRWDESRQRELDIFFSPRQR